MMKKLFGYTIAVIALISISFFSHYKGDLIPYPMLWVILSIIILLIGLNTAFTIRTKKETVTLAEYSIRSNKLIATGERIKLDIDSCDIKENNYYEEIPNQRTLDAQSIDAVFDPNENYEEKYVDQSAIIYYHKTGDTTEKYISQTFPFSSETLAFHILNNDIVLYVDRFDRNNYLFDLKNN